MVWMTTAHEILGCLAPFGNILKIPTSVNFHIFDVTGLLI